MAAARSLEGGARAAGSAVQPPRRRPVPYTSCRRGRGCTAGAWGLYKRGDPLHLDLRTPVATGVRQSGPDGASPAKHGRGLEGTVPRLLARSQAAGQRRAAGGPSHLQVVPA